MKKVAILLLLVLILSLSLTYTSVCFAWYTDFKADTFWEVADKNGVQTYLLENTEFKASIIIPYSYFFKVDGDRRDDGYQSISYNGQSDLYINTEQLDSTDVKATNYKQESEFQISPYYNLTISVPDNALQIYDLSFQPDPQTYSNITSLKFVGYTKHDNLYYFYTEYTIIIGGTTMTNKAYILASDVLASTFDPTNITIHPDSSKAKDDQNAKDVEVAQNKLKRNIFFFSICVVCVLVVLLIYNPFKKKTQSRQVNDISTNEDF